MQLKTFFLLTGFQDAQEKANQDIAELCAWVATHFPGTTIVPTIQFAELTGQVFVPYTPGTETTDVLSVDWVRANVYPLAKDYFQCFYIFNESLMSRPSTIGGEMLGKMGNTWMCPVTGRIDEQISTGDGKVHDNAILHRLKHEFLHVAEYVTGMYNIVHQYDGTATTGLDLETPAGILSAPFIKATSYPAPVPSPSPNPTVSTLQRIVAFLKTLLAGKSKIPAWAAAIKKHEGFFAPGQNPNYPNGTRSWKNNSPGNLRYTLYSIGLGALSKDAQNFAIFPSLPVGTAALERLLYDAATGKLAPTYLSTMTLRQCMRVYAPAADHNDPDAYAVFIANDMGISPETVIATLA
jgi:hypothetical protein